MPRFFVPYCAQTIVSTLCIVNRIFQTPIPIHKLYDVLSLGLERFESDVASGIVLCVIQADYDRVFGPTAAMPSVHDEGLAIPGDIESEF